MPDSQTTELSPEDAEDLARAIVVFLTMVGPHYGSKMYGHFINLGEHWPEWMTDIIPNHDHTPPMQCFAIAIAKLYGAEIND